MADDIQTGSTGFPVAAELAGVDYYQRIKLFDPTTGSTSAIGVSGNPLRIDPTGTTPQPVTGTFFQSTQPVAVSTGHIIVDSITATVPVSGTFFQSTQPVAVSTGHLIVDSVTASVAVTGTFWQSTQPVVVSTGVITSNPQRATTSSVTAVVSTSTASVQLSALNANRLGWSLFNDAASAPLYVKLGTTASTSSYSFSLAAGSFYEQPQPVYTGEIDGLTTSTGNTARITELTA